MAKSFYEKIVRAPRLRKQAALAAADTLLLLFSLWAAYSLRLGVIFTPNLGQALMMAAAPVIAIPIFTRMGLYRSVIRYMGEQALWVIFQAMSLAALLWTMIAFMAALNGAEGVPRSIPIIYWMLGMVMTSGLRFAARWALRLPMRARFNRQLTLIWGAGEAGRQLAYSMQQTEDITPVGFIDTDRRLIGGEMAGVRIYAPDKLPWLIERFGVRDVVVCLPQSSVSKRGDIVSLLEKHNMRVLILPPLTDIARGRYLVNMVRELDVEDVLGRDPAAADETLLRQTVEGKNVLVTGAGGSIGSELCKQIARLAPASLVMVEASEAALYQVDRAIAAEPAPPPRDAVLGSVRDEPLMRRLMREKRIQTVYHAAAHKHVPLVESNVVEGVRNNIDGTRVTAEAALEAGVETFVLISSDKAVRPTNVMGATKRWAELVMLSAAARAAAAGTGQRFCAVRFGNVFGSSGSVIPLFKEQIAMGGPVTVTHQEVTRYFMSISEAVQLVIQAGGMTKGGEVFLLDMGDPVRIIDLARKMIRLAGYTVNDDASSSGDIEIKVTGLRPGEKLYEELLIDNANAQGTQHPKIMLGLEPSLSDEALSAEMAELERLIQAGDVEALRAQIIKVATER